MTAHTTGLAALEERVRAGDATVSAEDLARAASLERLAQLRQDGDVRQAAAARDAEASTRRAGLVAEAQNVLGARPLGDIARLYATAREALAALVEACEGRTDAVTAAAQLLIGPAVTEVPGPAVNARWTGGRSDAYVELDGVRHSPLEPGPVVQHLVASVAQAHPRGLPLDNTHSVVRRLGPPVRIALDDVVVKLAENRPV
ncbi:hypothetical protein KPP03845_102726 [Streptomyces xanthophaeus]|uniref:hypothetical protein n=1 Tax=Streptomyces xanthophaeus TaxID=67385 RepID=UPI00233F2C16|nr:hypothetical protein [Streptomyces xanthophaeus]WCD86380.1 hypothetical protein KPP03845_102726 [Streptomyces xanthophaeus]